MQMTLAEALLKRKELQQKIERLGPIQNKDLYITRTGRKPAAEGIDDIIAQVPQVTLDEFTRSFDHYARCLRLCDAAIQKANWATTVDIPDEAMQTAEDRYPKK